MCKFCRCEFRPSFLTSFLLIFQICIVQWINCTNTKDELNYSYNGEGDTYLLQSVAIHLNQTLLPIKKISATRTNSEKSPAGGGSRGWIRNGPKLVRLHYHLMPINQGKGGEHSAMVSITQSIYVLFIKWYVLSIIRKCAHDRLSESLARDEGVIYIIHTLVGVTGKCWFLW